MCDGTGAIWVSENNLKNMLDKHGLFQGSTADDVKYVFSKERAMEDINGVLDTRTNSNGVKEYKCPDVLAESYKPITCRARQWVANNLLLLLAVFAQLAGFTTLVLKFWRKRYLTKRAEHLYHQVCDTLEDNALMSKSMGDREPWLIASRLRDHLLTPRKEEILFYGKW
ncbi:Ribonuclease Z [Bienertia sinuspersici]